jgi:hypothetical protein
MIDTEGCDVIYIRDGKVAEVHAYFDLMITIQKILMPLPARIIGGLVGSIFPR